MRKIFVTFIILAGVFTAKGQQQEGHTAVIQVIEKLFDGMRAGDSTMVNSVFLKDAELYTTFTNKENQPVLHKGSLQEFLNAIGTPHEVIWDEPIWNTEVRIDGNLAQVWTDYAFYAGDQFSHCGVDAFHLFKTTEGWKIYHLTDTRKWKNCNVPEEVKEKFKK